MFGQHSNLRDSLRKHNHRVDHACHAKLGIGIVTWRSIKYVFQICVLGFTLYLLEYQTVEPILAMIFVGVLISGPDIFEWWLVREDYVEYEEVTRQDRD